MIDNNDPQELGEAISWISKEYGKTVCEAADWLYAQMATANVSLPVLVAALNYAGNSVRTLAPVPNGKVTADPPERP